MKTDCGTLLYVALEVLGGGGKIKYDGEKADIWSAGVVLFIILTGHPPFTVANSTDWWFNCLQAGNYSHFWQCVAYNIPLVQISPETQLFLNKILAVDPSSRSSVDELLSDPWLECSSGYLNFFVEDMTCRSQQVHMAVQQELAQTKMNRKVQQVKEKKVDVFSRA
eukprot:CAMPEP_0113942528 /NCGR_PEP_ID=MMETSP1339-20121228/8231_1 /TAXON_ID=94617 /ORGANISM="Fibrocapsa japonica" /LENGTH=165 /DNA_ID=CAMNT_0000947041 /DNA_START=3 /DNA_END=496 /DNA_ORIENTATION=+ /assembly_acc=CAM_ASM_000762